jgi:hypothetical protein
MEIVACTPRQEQLVEEVFGNDDCLGPDIGFGRPSDHPIFSRLNTHMDLKTPRKHYESLVS